MMSRRCYWKAGRSVVVRRYLASVYEVIATLITTWINRLSIPLGEESLTTAWAEEARSMQGPASKRCVLIAVLLKVVKVGI